MRYRIPFVPLLLALFVLVGSTTPHAEAAGGIITTFAGGGVGDDGLATSAVLHHPSAVALDSSDNLYIADTKNCRIRKVTGATITTVAGNGACVSNGGGDGGAATSAPLYAPIGVAVDGSGNLYIADGCRVRVVSGGTISAFAGNGSCTYAGDGGLATSAGVAQPKYLAADGAGNVYIAETNNSCRIRKVSGGNITTVAGNATCAYAGDGGLAVSASLYYPQGLAVDGGGNLYIGDSSCRIRQVSAGNISTIAGNGTCGFSGDGGPATNANIYGPRGMTADSGGTLQFVDFPCRIREISGGTITTIAGNGTCGFSGDGGLATSAGLYYPQGVALSGGGDLYIADTDNCRVRKVSATTIATAAGTGACSFSGDGGPPTSASLNLPFALAVDGGSNLYIADGYNCRIRKVSGDVITTVAGTGTCTYGGDGGLATSAGLGPQNTVAVDTSGNLYIAEGPSYNGCRIREVIGDNITTIAGNGNCAVSADGAPASSSIYRPGAIALDSLGNLYFVENCSVRRISGGTITTVAGNGPCTYGGGGDGGPATSVGLYYPQGLAVDSVGNLYIVDMYGCRIRQVSGGIITTVAGNGTCGFSGDGGPAPSASLHHPASVAVDSSGRLYIGDFYNCRVRRVSGGTITTVAGNGTCGLSGDGGAATSASIGGGGFVSLAVAVDADDNLYIADLGSNRIRMVTPLTSVGGISVAPDVAALRAMQRTTDRAPWVWVTAAALAVLALAGAVAASAVSRKLSR